MSQLLVALLFIHGAAHLVGFAGPWRLIDAEGVTYQSSLFGGRIQVSASTMRALGIGWLLLACGFFASGVVAMVGAAWWSDATVGLVCASLALCAASWPAARVGVVANLVVLLILMLTAN